MSAARLGQLARQFASTASVGGDCGRAAAGAVQRAVHGAGRQCPQHAGRQHRSARGAFRSHRSSTSGRREGGRAGSSRGAPSAQWSAALASGSTPQVLFVDGVNPVFTAPPAWRVRDGARQGAVHRQLRQLPRRDERAGGSHPARSFVSRSRGPRRCRSPGRRCRVASVAPAVMRPLYDTRATPDVLLDIGSPAAAAARASMADVRRNARGLVRGASSGRHRTWMHGPTHRARGCGRARFRPR